MSRYRRLWHCCPTAIMLSKELFEISRNWRESGIQPTTTVKRGRKRNTEIRRSKQRNCFETLRWRTEYDTKGLLFSTLSSSILRLNRLIWKKHSFGLGTKTSIIWWCTFMIIAVVARTTQFNVIRWNILRKKGDAGPVAQTEITHSYGPQKTLPCPCDYRR